MQPGQSMSDPPTIGYVATADATPVFTPIGTNDWLTAPQDSALCGKPDGSVLYIAAVAPGQIGGTAIFAVALTAHAFPPSLMLGDFGPSTIVMLRHAVSRDGSRLYVQIHTTAGPATTIDVYDTSDFNAPVTTIDFGMALTGAMAMSPDTDFLYVGLQTYAVAIVDTRLQRIGIELSTVPPGQITWSDSALSPLPGPRGIAVSPDGATAYAAGAAFTRISRVLSVG